MPQHWIASRAAAAFTALVLAGGAAAVVSGPSGASADSARSPLGRATAATVVLPDPVVLYQEDFENAAPGAMLNTYTSVTGMTYTADSDWLDPAQCNGFIARYVDAVRPAGNCTLSSDPEYSYLSVRNKARGLGLLGAGDIDNNHALSTETARAAGDESMTPGQVMFRTASDLSLPSANGRFVTFSVDAAATACQSAAPLLRFYLAQGPVETAISADPINPCTDPRRVASGTAAYGRFAADGARLFTGSTLGIVLRNEQNTSAGNDGAIDNIIVYDATPTLSVEFDRSLAQTGATANLVVTVLNTSELSGKSGWGASVSLPSGLTVAGASAATCGGAITAAIGSASVAVTGGVLDSGASTCTVTIPVTSAVDRTYTIAPGSVGLTAVNAPTASAAVEFDSSAYTVGVASDVDRAHAGDVVTYTVTVANTGRFDLVALPVELDLSGVLDDATWQGIGNSGTLAGSVVQWTVDVPAGQNRQLTMHVEVSEVGGIGSPDAPVSLGDGLLQAALESPSAPGTCGVCAATTRTVAYAASIHPADPVAVGGQVATYRVNVVNLGTADFDVTHPLAFEVDLTESIDDATVITDGLVAAASDPIVPWAGSLAAGASTVLEVRMRVLSPLEGDGRMSATLQLSTAGSCGTACDAEIEVQPAVGPVVHTGGVAAVTSSQLEPHAVVGSLIAIAVLALIVAGLALGGVRLVARRGSPR